MDFLIILHFNNGKLPFIVKNVDGKTTAISQVTYSLLPIQQNSINSIEIMELFSEIKTIE